MNSEGQILTFEPLIDPQVVFDRLFGQHLERRERKSVLDFVREEIRTVPAHGSPMAPLGL